MPDSHNFASLMTKPEAESYCPKSQADWRAWLHQNHREKTAVWLIFYKKKSPCHNLTWSDSVDEALCYGWIDSTKRSIDDESYKQYFSPRKVKSNWSKVNKDKVKTLIAQGLMQEAGQRSITVAKANGSWTLLDGVEALLMPEDLGQALARQEGASAYYDSLSKSAKKILLYWVVSAKRPETRDKRIAEVVENASQQQKPKQFR